MNLIELPPLHFWEKDGFAGDEHKTLQHGIPTEFLTAYLRFRFHAGERKDSLTIFLLIFPHISFSRKWHFKIPFFSFHLWDNKLCASLIWGSSILLVCQALWKMGSTKYSVLIMEWETHLILLVIWYSHGSMVPKANGLGPRFLKSDFEKQTS